MRIGTLVQLSNLAAAEGHFEAAHHLLMAALHIASDSGDEPAVHDIVNAGKEQMQAVESAVPVHRLAKAEAKKRGTTSVYESLMTHADAVLLRLRSNVA